MDIRLQKEQPEQIPDINKEVVTVILRALCPRLEGMTIYHQVVCMTIAVIEFDAERIIIHYNSNRALEKLFGS